MEKDFLLMLFSLFRDESYNFFGADEEGNCIQGIYNRTKINPKEPDLRLYHWSLPEGRSEKEFLSLWLKVSQNGIKYLIGNEGGKHYIGLINHNRLSDDEPYLTIFQVLKTNKGAFNNEQFNEI